MREINKFGKRSSSSRPLPNNEKLKNTFGVVNKGCDSEQIISFVKKACGKDISEQEIKIDKRQVNDNKQKASEEWGLRCELEGIAMAHKMVEEEKKAEEYADKMLSNPSYPFVFSERVEREVKACIIKVYLDSLKCCENAYNKGLSEGKPKWHDLRKDPNDLPTKENVTIRCVLNNGNEVICETDWYSPTEDEIGYGKIIIQFYCNDDWIDTNDVIAWCELPKFEEE